MLAFRSKLGASSEAVSEKADALLKALQKSHFLDVWTVLQLLHQNTHLGVQEYICNRIPELGEATIERYLLQFIYLAVSKPGQHLERILLKLCAESFRIAIKTQWLLVALCQDHPKHKLLEHFREQAYKSALEGKWEVPIRSAKLDPLSPNASQLLSSPLCSPGQSYVTAHMFDGGVAIRPPASMVMSPPGTARGASLSSAITAEDLSVAVATAAVASEDVARWLVTARPNGPAPIPDPAAAPVSQQCKQHGQVRVQDGAGAKPPPLSLDCDVESLAAPIRTATATTRDQNGTAATEERILALKRELGEGEGVSALLERARKQPVAAVEDDPPPFPMDDERPMSPLTQLRWDTFGATLDFVEALCDASSSLTSYPAAGEERQNALRAGLEHINGEIEKANRRPVAIWFPMGRKGDRVLRIAAREAVLLNSREKAPFLLFVEVLEGQNECGDDLDSAYPLGGSTGCGNDLKRSQLVDLGDGGGSGVLSASMMSLSPGPKVEFGRRETYGIALTGIGAQHQQQFMHSVPGGTAAAVKAVETRKPRDSPEPKNQAGAVASVGRTSLSSPVNSTVDSAACGSPSTGLTVAPPSRPQATPDDMLISPTPTRAASLTHPLLLEDHAGAVAIVRQSRPGTPTPPAGPSAEAAPEAFTDRTLSRLSAGSTASAAPVPPAATEVIIPTRSASNNNIAAVAAAALAASASCGGGGAIADSILASARSSEGGAAAAGVAGGGVIGQPQTPRSGSSLSCLPPRPPSASSSSALYPAQQQQHLPVGGISPINAAKEVSSGGGPGPEGSGLLAASNLLRRVFGDRAESGSETQAAPAASARPQNGQIKGLSPAVANGVPAYLLAVAAGDPNLKPPVHPGGRPSSLGAATGRNVPAMPKLDGAHVAEGLFSTQSLGKSEQEVMALLSHISASLRGEAPMVRVKIISMESGSGGSTNVGIGGGMVSGGGGAAAAPSLISTLHSRAKAALLSQPPTLTPPAPLNQQQLAQQPPPAGPEDSLDGGHSKTMALLSRLGLCRKPTAEDDAEEHGGGQGAAAVAAAAADGPAGASGGAALSAAAASAARGSGGSLQVTIPITSSGVAAARPPAWRSARRDGAEPKLVRLVLTVATQEMCLDIKSPHRKSRRTPSHEAIEAMAGKYNVAALPPPTVLGPPLGPAGVDSSGASMERVSERASEEEEASADAALPGTRAAPISTAAGEPMSTNATAVHGIPSVGQQSACVAGQQSADPREQGGGGGGLRAPEMLALQPAQVPPAWTSRPVPVAEGAAAAAARWPEPTALLPQLAGGHQACQSATAAMLTAASQPPDSKALEAVGPGASGPSASVLAASLQSFSRILKSGGTGQQQQSQPAPAAQASQPSTERGSVDTAGGPDADAKAVTVAPQAPPPRAGSPTLSEVGGGAGSATGLTASLHSSLNRFLNRSAPSETGQSGSSGGMLRPRGVSPVRSSGGQTQQAATTAVAPVEVPASDKPQRMTSGITVPEGGPVAAAPSGAGLAASIHSSLNRFLNRSGTDKPASEGQTSVSGGSSSNPLGPSPRGGSPVRPSTSASSGGSGPSASAQTPPSSDAAAASGSGGRLAKLGFRVRGQQPEAPAPSASLLHQALSRDQQQLQPGQPAASRRGSAGNQSHSEQELVEAGAAAAAGARMVPRPLRFTDGRYERESLEDRRRREANAVYGERWTSKVKRIQRESPHGRRQGWALRCVIVKSGDDCRQELLALQLVRTFGDIFTEAGLPLWVRYYEVLVTSNKTALIEMVPNTVSIHTIKSRSAPGTSLSDHFFAKFGRSGTPECTAAQRRFTESLAAYSLICYLLQIKDRHNGNILVDDDGRVVHIDYGFLLSNSPGGVNFESAPFKLTRELLEVMDSNSDGRPSEMFDYFKVLMIQGFIAVRSCSDRIMLLVKIMSKSGFPCFKGGERALKALEKRLMLALGEVQCVEHVLQLIAESLDAWRTRQYDYYQRVLNGIL